MDEILTTDELYVAHTGGVKILNTWSSKMGMNRFISEELMGKLDPHGVHLAQRVMIHTWRARKKIKPHYRVQWLLKVTENSPMEPHYAYMDIDPELFAQHTREHPLVPKQKESEA